MVQVRHLWGREQEQIKDNCERVNSDGVCLALVDFAVLLF